MTWRGAPDRVMIQTACGATSRPPARQPRVSATWRPSGEFALRDATDQIDTARSIHFELFALPRIKYHIEAEVPALAEAPNRRLQPSRLSCGEVRPSRRVPDAGRS